MVGQVSVPWPIEEIPDADRLFMRVHQVFIRNGEVRSACFKDQPRPGTGMSTDWSRYSTPERTRAGGPKPPSLYAVVALNVGEVRRIPDQRVVHDPLTDNRAHTLVHGPKGDAHPQIRLQYLPISRIVVPPDQPVGDI